MASIDCIGISAVRVSTKLGCSSTVLVHNASVHMKVKLALCGCGTTTRILPSTTAPSCANVGRAEYVGSDSGATPRESAGGALTAHEGRAAFLLAFGAVVDGRRSRASHPRDLI